MQDARAVLDAKRSGKGTAVAPPPSRPCIQEAMLWRAEQGASTAVQPPLRRQGVLGSWHNDDTGSFEHGYGFIYPERRKKRGRGREPGIFVLPSDIRDLEGLAIGVRLEYTECINDANGKTTARCVTRPDLRSRIKQSWTETGGEGEEGDEGEESGEEVEDEEDEDEEDEEDEDEDEEDEGASQVRPAVALAIQLLHNSGGSLMQGQLSSALYQAGPHCREEVASMGGVAKGPGKVPKGAFGAWLAWHSSVFEVQSNERSSNEWLVRLKGRAQAASQASRGQDVVHCLQPRCQRGVECWFHHEQPSGQRAAARRDAEAVARQEAEAAAKREAEEKAGAEAAAAAAEREAQEKAAKEAAARREAEEKARREAAEKVRREAEAEAAQASAAKAAKEAEA